MMGGRESLLGRQDNGRILNVPFRKIVGIGGTGCRGDAATSI